ncbi:MAG: PQQ-dependent sugar dehydrogenase [Brachybacterium sp.]|nr:PQQ-dependent sugar dehydrogenase [Brachybacterium sp.]
MRCRTRALALVAGAALLIGCSGGGPDDAETVRATPAEQTTNGTEADGTGADGGVDSEVTDEFVVTEHGTFDEGWAMTFLPGSTDAPTLLISERGGSLQLHDTSTSETTEVSGVPGVHHAGQGGLHDIILGPDFEDTGEVYLSWVRDGEDGPHGVIARAVLDRESADLTDLEEIWEQTPANGDGHFALRLLIQDEHLYVTSGDRQELDPAQETDTNLGAVLRLTLDGEPAAENPYAEDGGSAAELWTIGHRNPLGIAEDADGDIWVSEMGPAGGDELNLLEAGENYGWPEVSMGEHYDGTAIPDHEDGDGYRAPAEYWVPAISPGSLLIYQGELFEGWQDSALLGGLSGQNLVRVDLEGEDAAQAQSWDMGERIRALAEAPDGAVWILEDGSAGRLLELRPA